MEKELAEDKSLVNQKESEQSVEEKEEKDLEESKKELVGKVTDTEIKDALSSQEENFKDFFEVVKKYPMDKKLTLVTLEHSDKFKKIAGEFRNILTASKKVSDPDRLLLALVEVAQSEDTANKFYEKVTDHENMVHNSLLEQFYWYFIIGLTKVISEEKEKKAA